VFHGSKIRIKFTAGEKNWNSWFDFGILSVGADWTFISVATHAMEGAHDD